jgi:peptide/nickel transport system permease protein
MSAAKRELRYLSGILRKMPSAGLGLLIIITAIVMAVIPSQLARFAPEEADLDSILLPPNAIHWFGTDVNGMDIFSRVVWASRVDLTITVAATLLGGTIGTGLGAWSGYRFGSAGWGGFASDVLMRSMDVVQAFPIFILALGLVAALGRNIFNLIFVLALLNVPVFLRLTRSEVLRTREEGFIDAARCSGNSERRLILRHILPNSLTPAVATASIASGTAVLLTAGLSFIGAGVPAPTPEWGYMVAIGAPSLYTGQWWPALFPGAWIGVVVLGFALLGEGIREYLDPENR